MNVFPSSFFYEVVTLYVVLDPVAAIPIFLAATRGLDTKDRLKVAFYGVAVAFVIFLFFIAIGHQLLDALHIPMASFQLAGSIVLMLFGLQMAMGHLPWRPSFIQCSCSACVSAFSSQSWPAAG